MNDQEVNRATFIGLKDAAEAFERIAGTMSADVRPEALIATHIALALANAQPPGPREHAIVLERKVKGAIGWGTHVDPDQTRKALCNWKARRRRKNPKNRSYGHFDVVLSKDESATSAPSVIIEAKRANPSDADLESDAERIDTYLAGARPAFRARGLCAFAFYAAGLKTDAALDREIAELVRQRKARLTAWEPVLRCCVATLELAPRNYWFRGTLEAPIEPHDEPAAGFVFAPALLRLEPKTPASPASVAAASGTS